MTNWFKGIDEGLSTPGGAQVALAGYFFVDAVNGSDLTGDGSPNNPWQTYQHALNNVPDGFGIGDVDSFDYKYSTVIVLASGTYQLTANSSRNSFTTTANINGQVNITSSSNLLINASDYRFEGVTLKGWFAIGIFRIYLDDCILDDSRLNRTSGTGQGQCRARNTIFIKPDITTQENLIRVNQLSGALLYLDKCTFVNGYGIRLGQIGVGVYANAFLTNCDLSGVGDIEISDFFISNNGEINLTNCNYSFTEVVNLDGGGTIPIGSVLGVRVDNVDVSSSFSGNPKNLELTIEPNSPLIGAGQNNSTIGALRVGELVDLSSPAENNDITVGATIEITNPATTGNIKPTLKTLSQIRKSPIVSINGLSNNIDNIPDNETTLIPPKRNTINILYRETVGGSNLTGEFLYGAPMFKDDLGNTTGEDDFNPFDIDTDGDLKRANNLDSSNVIDVAQIQENFVLNDQ